MALARRSPTVLLGSLVAFCAFALLTGIDRAAQAQIPPVPKCWAYAGTQLACNGCTSTECAICSAGDCHGVDALECFYKVVYVPSVYGVKLQTTEEPCSQFVLCLAPNPCDGNRCTNSTIVTGLGNGTFIQNWPAGGCGPY